MIGRSLVRISSWGGTELHVEVSLSKILKPRIAPDVQLAPCVAATAISKGPAMSWRLISGCTLAFAHEWNWIWRGNIPRPSRRRKRKPHLIPLDVTAPNAVLEFWPVKQKMSNKIWYFNWTELGCPQLTVIYPLSMVNTLDTPGPNCTDVPLNTTFFSEVPALYHSLDIWTSAPWHSLCLHFLTHCWLPSCRPLWRDDVLRSFLSSSKESMMY